MAPNSTLFNRVVSRLTPGDLRTLRNVLPYVEEGLSTAEKETIAQRERPTWSDADLVADQFLARFPSVSDRLRFIFYNGPQRIDEFLYELNFQDEFGEQFYLAVHSDELKYGPGVLRPASPFLLRKSVETRRGVRSFVILILYISKDGRAQLYVNTNTFNSLTHKQKIRFPLLLLGLVRRAQLRRFGPGQDEFDMAQGTAVSGAQITTGAIEDTDLVDMPSDFADEEEEEDLVRGPMRAVVPYTERIGPIGNLHQRGIKIAARNFRRRVLRRR